MDIENINCPDVVQIRLPDPLKGSHPFFYKFIKGCSKPKKEVI